MKKINPFFLIGTVGMFVTAVLHIVLTYLPEGKVPEASSILYPLFLVFLLNGTRIMIKRKTKSFVPGKLTS